MLKIQIAKKWGSCFFFTTPFPAGMLLLLILLLNFYINSVFSKRINVGYSISKVDSTHWLPNSWEGGGINRSTKDNWKFWNVIIKPVTENKSEITQMLFLHYRAKTVPTRKRVNKIFLKSFSKKIHITFISIYSQN